jgi:8-amino-7-oxononanoate synthase
LKKPVANNSVSSLDHILEARLQRRQSEGLYRTLKSDSTLVDFCSNDYLGLARSATLSDLINHKLNLLPVRNGAAGSRLLSGNTEYTEEVERKLSAIFKAESALIFNSGYSANLAVLSAIPQKNDTIIYDELAHACIKDGARLSLAKRFSFRHNDLGDLERKIKHAHGKIFIAVESIYSMDGDQCPLESLTKLARKYDASVILDEAHSTGSYGHSGSGLATTLNLEKEIDIRIYTFGKAMGIHGACVAGSKSVHDYMVNFGRPFIYTTALPPHTIASIDCAFKFLSDNISLQNELQAKVNLFLRHLSSHINRTASASSIQTAIVSGNLNAKNAAGKLQRAGFDVRPILSPTVPKDFERLRITLHAYNTDEEITNLANELSKL